MADAAHRRLADQASIVDDDPFAELTRIMGFDPRQPISRPEPKPAPVVADDAAMDFELDLERELTGDFVAQGEAAPAAAVQDFEHADAGRDDFDHRQHAVDHDEPQAPAVTANYSRHDDFLASEPDFDLSEEAYGSLAMTEAEPAGFPADVRAAVSDDHGMPLHQAGAVSAARLPDRFETQVDLPPLPIGAHAPALGPSPLAGSPQLSGDDPKVDDFDLMLESELDALLGNALPAGPVDRGHVDVAKAPAADDRDAGFAGRFDALDPETDYDASDELEGRAVEQGSGYDAGPLAAAASRWSAQAAHVEAPVQASRSHDADLSFDDAAFDTAIASGLNAGSVTENARTASEKVDSTENRADAEMPRDGQDPYAALTALSADLKGSSSWTDAAPQSMPASRGQGTHAAEMPDIDTVDVPEQAVALADDLDLPEFAFEDEPATAAAYDDIDAEFASLLNEMNALESDGHGRSSARGAESVMSAMAAREIRLDQPAGTPAVPADLDDRRYVDDRAYGEADGGDYASNRNADAADMAFAYDPDAEEDVAPAYESFAPKPSRSKALMVAALVASVAVLGGVGAFALSFGDGTSGEVALVKADPSPTKVRPENPGGVTIPNQDNKVYDSVAGAGEVPEPTQKALVQSAETPMELPLPDDEADFAEADVAVDAMNGSEASVTAAAPKAEDRVEQIAAEPGVDASVEVAAVPPRKVRTMIVKADGTLVAREEADPETTATTVDTASESIVDNAAMPASAPVEAVPAAAPAVAAPAKKSQTSSTTPGAAPIAPVRPSDQPVDIVGEVQPQQVAALAPATGGWAMQIASQPSEAAAQASYQSLSRRYASVLGGKQASIVKAEISGKGTYWRVRVAAGSRSDAVKLCESYKAAGGSCFVSK